MYATAYSSIFEQHKHHRARFSALQRRRNPAITYEFRRGDYVLINNKKVVGLTPNYLVPFMLINLTDNSNAIVRTDDNDSCPPNNGPFAGNASSLIRLSVGATMQGRQHSDYNNNLVGVHPLP